MNMRRINKILLIIISFLLIFDTLSIKCIVWNLPISKVNSAGLKVSKDYINDEAQANEAKEEDLLVVRIEYETIDNQNTIEETTAKKSSSNTTVKTSNSEYPDGNVNNFSAQIAKLKSEYPSGYYWNHAGGVANGSVTKIPCNHNANENYCNTYQGKSTQICGFSIGRQCAGFTSMLSDRIFGKDAPTRIFYNYDDIRIGDQARINNNSHTVFILEKTDDYVVVAECNADYKTCTINWGRKIYRNNLKGFYITRYQ